MDHEEKPNPGDLIEFKRGIYQHWAVYVGDGFVVHLVPPCAGAGSGSMMAVVVDRAMVKKEKLTDVVGNDKYTVKNSLDQECNPRPAQVIVKEACGLVGNELPYSITGQNCEHFVNELRYKAESWQVRKATIVVILTAGGALLLGLATALFRALFGGSKKENKNTE
ncbi:HRAS-like suppressor 3 isoform X2 [Parambassis ranga]|uniref:HRAS-like suppressor 3 isoform X2 n=1 Tax=Parambassis ranga TaxID=210632 RepID=A0A6P7J7A8_9TELE|nr:HRAS-like suppressor 3 isoform X2 [Parambassis ranga]